MSDELITIEAKTKTGNIQQFQVAEIISIDGQPYRPASETEQIRQLVNHLSGRVAALEAILSNGNGEQ